MERGQYARIVFLCLLLLTLYFVFRILGPFLPALVWAAILATVSYPFFEWLSEHLKRPKLAGVLTCVLVTLLVVLPLIFVLILLAQQSVQAYDSLQSRINVKDLSRLDVLRHTAPYQWALSKMQALGLPEPDLRTALVRAVRAISEFLVGNSAAVFSGLARFVFHFFIALLALYYFLLRGPDVLRRIRRIGSRVPSMSR